MCCVCYRGKCLNVIEVWYGNSGKTEMTKQDLQKDSQEMDEVCRRRQKEDRQVGRIESMNAGGKSRRGGGGGLVGRGDRDVEMYQQAAAKKKAQKEGNGENMEINSAIWQEAPEYAGFC